MGLLVTLKTHFSLQPVAKMTYLFGTLKESLYKGNK
jgi:hypothetical protein